jgi:hypothetical protein
MKTTARFFVSMLACSLLASTAITAEPLRRVHSNVERISLERLTAVHADVEKLESQRIDIPSRPGLNDYRCILHAHAEDSTHTGGTLPEMLADAKKAGVHAILLTDHFRPPADFIDGRRRGMKDGGDIRNVADSTTTAGTAPTRRRSCTAGFMERSSCRLAGAL